MKTINTFFFILLSMVSLLNAQSENAGLQLKTRIVNGKTSIRWSPSDYATWRLGMENGYMIHVTRTNNTTGESNSYILRDSIMPHPENSWTNNQQNQYIDLAHALCYDFSQSVYEGPQGAFTAAEDENNRFNFMLMTADIEIGAAFRMGLAERELNLESGYSYEYKVFLLETDLQSNTSSVNMDSIPPLPAPQGVAIEFGKEEFYIHWQKDSLQAYYTTYTIEYSDDGGATFQAMNERPFVYFENPSIPAEAQTLMTYRDSISADIPEYQFRIIGNSPFGENGPASAIVSGRSVPDPLLVFPQITEVLELADSSFRISWEINEATVDSIQSINLYRYQEFPGGEATLLTTTALAPDVRNFIDDTPMTVNYYQVEVTDIFGFRHTSAAGLGQLTDSIPPLIPTGVFGTIDSLSDTTMLVQLSWLPNQEDDFAGYYVYRSNNPNHEFTHLTTSGYITDTTFSDIILSAVLSDSIFYRIKSVDFSGNISDFSNIIAIQRPDMIPPAPPALGLVAGEDGLEWINSSSKDVVSYRIERRPFGETGDWSTVSSQAKTNLVADVIPKSLIKEEQVYTYRVVAIDDAGLESASNEVTLRPSPLEKPAIPKMTFNLEAETNDNNILLKWKTNTTTPVKKVIVFRAVDNAPAIEHAHLTDDNLRFENTINGPLLRYEDPFTEEDRTYRYKVQFQYEDGAYSNLSNEALIQR